MQGHPGPLALNSSAYIRPDGQSLLQSILLLLLCTVLKSLACETERMAPLVQQAAYHRHLPCGRIYS